MASDGNLTALAAACFAEHCAIETQLCALFHQPFVLWWMRDLVKAARSHRRITSEMRRLIDRCSAAYGTAIGQRMHALILGRSPRAVPNAAASTEL